MNKQYITDNAATFKYLFRLQESGRTNMFGAGAYLVKERGLERKQATELLSFWMTNYDEIATQLEVSI